jgi:hypothetical protein
MERGASRDEIATRLGKIWDSVDNRAGQLVYDNLFWNKTAKDLGFLAIRSLGWNLGTIRELGGAAMDTGRQIGKLAQGRRDLELTHRMAYAIALPMVTGSVGALYGYFATGQLPRNGADYFFPKDAEGNRKSFPTYMRDVYGFDTHPAQTLVHKLHPLFGQIVEMYQNQDYYGYQIYDPSDPGYRQGVDVAKHLLKGFTPIGLQAGLESVRTGSGLSGFAQSLVGITPAPKYIGQSKAEEYFYNIAKRHMEAGPHSRDEAAKEDAYMRLRLKFEKGKLSSAALADAMRKGYITASQIDRLYEERGKSGLVRHASTKNITLPELFKGYSLASPDEQAQLRPIILDKFDSTLDNFPPDQQRDLVAQVRTLLNSK